MKRVRTDYANLADYELRNNKVRKVGIMPGWFMNGLGQSDVWKHIGFYLRSLQWSELWFSGRLQFFNMTFDNGDIVHSKWHVDTRTEVEAGSQFLFNSWWGFLEEGKKIKKENGWWRQTTVATSRYWMIGIEKIHKWESFHCGQKGGGAYEMVESDLLDDDEGWHAEIN